MIFGLYYRRRFGSPAVVTQHKQHGLPPGGAAGGEVVLPCWTASRFLTLCGLCRREITQCLSDFMAISEPQLVLGNKKKLALRLHAHSFILLTCLLEDGASCRPRRWRKTVAVELRGRPTSAHEILWNVLLLKLFFNIQSQSFWMFSFYSLVLVTRGGG